MTQADIAAGLRGVAIALIDKHNQLEARLNSLNNNGEWDEALAEVRAQRAMVRHWLGELRAIDRAVGDDGGGGVPHAVHPHGGPPGDTQTGRAPSHSTENFKNTYRDARE